MVHTPSPSLSRALSLSLALALSRARSIPCPLSPTLSSSRVRTPPNNNNNKNVEAAVRPWAALDTSEPQHVQARQRPAGGGAVHSVGSRSIDRWQRRDGEGDAVGPEEGSLRVVETGAVNRGEALQFAVVGRFARAVHVPMGLVAFPAGRRCEWTAERGGGGGMWGFRSDLYVRRAPEIRSAHCWRSLHKTVGGGGGTREQ